MAENEPEPREIYSHPQNQPQTLPSEITRQLALVIGIGQYTHVSQLANAPRDARALADLLHADYGFDLLPQGKALLDEAATLSALQTTIQDSLAQADAATRWLFYFAGHGDVVKDQGYLLPFEAETHRLETYLPIAWLIEQCQASRCAEALIILDACYCGSALVRRDELSDYVPDASRPDRVIQIIASGSPDQPVLDGGGGEHSVFTQPLLEALAGWLGVHDAPRPRDLTGLNRPVRSLSVSALYAYLRQAFPDRLEAAGAAPYQQQIIYGKILSSRSGREFKFGSRQPRLSPNLVRSGRDGRTSQRVQALEGLVEEVQKHPDRLPAAAELAAAHLRRTPQVYSVIEPSTRQEPDASVRARAAQTLGDLQAVQTWSDLASALDDELTVAQAAAEALGKLKVTETAQHLLAHLPNAADELFLYLVDAIGAIGEPESILAALRIALQKKKLVPFIGPDFPQALTGMPSRADFVSHLAEYEGIQPAASLAEIAAKVTRDGANRYALVSAMKRAFDNQLKQPGPIHQALAKFDLPLWISAAYDGLLIKALKANPITMGVDTQYWKPDRPTVVRLLGDVSGVRGLVALEADYENLREDEGDRRLLVNFLHQELQGKVALFLGFDPASLDFKLLVEYILNKRLTEADVRIFLVWDEASKEHSWGAHRLHPLRREALACIQSLQPGDTQT